MRQRRRPQKTRSCPSDALPARDDRDVRPPAPDDPRLVEGGRDAYPGPTARTPLHDARTGGAVLEALRPHLYRRLDGRTAAGYGAAHVSTRPTEPVRSEERRV